MFLDAFRIDGSVRHDQITVSLPQKCGSGGVSIPCAEEGQITVRLADTKGQRNAATLLLNRMYAWRGYGDHHAISDKPTHTTFTASNAREMLGTITLAVDSAGGLGVDKLFKEEVDQFRSVPGTRVCELTRFAFDTNKPSKPMLATLFHLIFIYGQRVFACTDLFIEVNPRHVRFYEIMLGFTRVGDLKMNDAVSAPSQLLWLSVSDIRRRVDNHKNSNDARSRRSLYAYFFSPKEEDGLFGRLIGQRPFTRLPDQSAAEQWNGRSYSRHELRQASTQTCINPLNV
ncbi:N-acyl amino acid synthase FeeM domain-containing protein [Sphingomonas sp. Ag1]|jgi:hypothetical protein|uniref:N-acyl amino acid synthase FeeM domain-containing protein n=1 Tax=Sphingomonas sp. Ag1 TaxID=1642949 RepID=UPI000B16EA4D|nr:hypothetical protein [Sphingomonas sp. Ag1]